MSNSSTWTLIAGEADAAIWTSENGASNLLRLIRQETVYDMGKDDCRRDFAWQLMSELSRGVQNGACKGVILIADEDMLEALGRMMVPEVKRLLLAEIPAAPETTSAVPSEKVSMVAWGTLQ